jgi:streptogramin lyase
MPNPPVGAALRFVLGGSVMPFAVAIARASRRALLLSLPLALVACGGSSSNRSEGPPPAGRALEGRITAASDGAPVGHAVLIAEHRERGFRVAARPRLDGEYRLELPIDGRWHVSVRAAGFTSAPIDSIDVTGTERRTFDTTLTPSASPDPDKASSVWLAALPDGEMKRRYVLDCTGCHQLNETRAFKGVNRRTADEWTEDAARMLEYAGATSGFPVISADCDPRVLGPWLATHLATAPSMAAAHAYGDVTTGLARSARPGLLPVRITEYDMPVPQDLPHDVAIAKDGAILVTGMFTHHIFRVHPDSGVVGALPIPVDKANPRAIEVDGAGHWWILCGNPKRVARYEPEADRWTDWDIGMYPHSIAPSEDGRAVWFNGHFTRDPELIGRLDPATGVVTTLAAPMHPTLGSVPGGPIPYEARLAPNGWFWMSELQGNRMIGYDPANDSWRAIDLPTTWSGPRRFDVGPDGLIWIPTYAANSLLRFDPATNAIEEIALPIRDSVPYVARVDPRTGHVWIGTAAADVVYRYDPSRKVFDVVPMLTRGASMRHMAIDPATGAVWVAFGAAPAIHPARIARIEVLPEAS